jgi:D-serine deaminase-like pyridoxal phosphate-dependent protein
MRDEVEVGSAAALDKLVPVVTFRRSSVTSTGCKRPATRRGFKDYGLLPDYPGARIYQLAEEHGFVDPSTCDHAPAIGEVVRVLPNHVCPVVNFDRVLTTRNSRPTGTLAIDAHRRVA